MPEILPALRHCRLLIVIHAAISRDMVNRSVQAALMVRK
jgi:hypothetical protein